MKDLIALGYISKAFGLKGGVGVKLFNQDSSALAANKSFTLRLGKNPDRVLNISSILDGSRVFFEDISDRSQALELVGSRIFLSRDDLPPIKDDEYYLSDILNSKVLLKNGDHVGDLVGFSSNSAQTLLEIKTQAGHIASVPLVKPIVQDIDPNNKIITIDPPEGLLEKLD